MQIPLPEPMAWRQIGRGTGWLLIALVGAILIGHLGDLGVNEYTARWAGGMFKISSVVYGGYRVSRDVLRIDPSMSAGNPVACSIMHLARACVIGAFAIAICLAV